MGMTHQVFCTHFVFHEVVCLGGDTAQEAYKFQTDCVHAAMEAPNKAVTLIYATHEFIPLVSLWRTHNSLKAGYFTFVL